MTSAKRPVLSLCNTNCKKIQICYSKDQNRKVYQVVGRFAIKALNIIIPVLNISKLKSRDSTEIKLLARAVTIWVYNVVLSYVQNEQDTEEVIQDTLLAALQGLDKFKSESSLKTWVYSIAVNKSKDALKHKHRKKRHANVISISRHAETDGVDIVPSNFVHPGIQLESKEQMDLLFSAINMLPAKQKEAIILTKLEQMSMHEAAGVMSNTQKAVESLVSRAKANLTLHLEELGIVLKNKKR